MKQYNTNDIYLTSYLISSDKCQLVRIEDCGGRRKTFVLEPIPSDETISNFYGGRATVSALTICNQLRSLKAACQNTKGGRNDQR